jgi:cytochrome c556
MWKRWIVLSGAWIILGPAGLPQENARAVSGPDAITARQATMDLCVIAVRSIDGAMKAGGEAKSQGFAAAGLAKWAKALPGMFPPGTGKGETSASTQALAAIWKDRAGFDQAAANYAAATARLASLAGTNDTAGFTKQLEEVNQACSSCHTRYKETGANPHGK